MKRTKLPLVILGVAIVVVGYVFVSNRTNENEVNSEESTLTETKDVNQIPEQSNETKVDSASVTATAKKPVSSSGKLVDIKVPFTSQAPTGNWDDQRQQDGCEEASLLMAIYWAQGKSLNSQIALREITGASDYELKNHGEYRDTSVDDAVEWIAKGYFKHDKVAVKRSVSISDIVAELEKGNVVVAPMNGQKLGNPYFSPPGPERHMLVIRGYDPVKKQFITNDPGTKRGAAYRYSEKVIYDALLAYPTGSHEPISKVEKHIIVVSK